MSAEAKTGSKPVLEREYTINLRRTREVSRTKRAAYAVRLIRRFVARHMKVDPSQVKIHNEVNEAIWSRSIEKPPRKIKVKVVKYEDGTVWVYLYKEETVSQS
ncbi:MAG: 50S ribosomal protein L31e [Crenarchaeota archaeon]|nr:50S ribosomal protein L31e [Thermoproteota archaeon]